jgi:hypothetical protein
MRNVRSAVCSHAALTWMQFRQRETTRNVKMKTAVLGLKNSPVVDLLASHAAPSLRQLLSLSVALSYAPDERVSTEFFARMAGN